MNYQERQKIMDAMKQGVRQQAEALEQQKAENTSEINFDDHRKMNADDMEITIKEMAGAIVELTTRLDAYEKGGADNE